MPVYLDSSVSLSITPAVSTLVAANFGLVTVSRSRVVQALPLIYAALMANGDAARRVAAGVRLQSLHERLIRTRALGEGAVVRRRHIAPRSACWLEGFHDAY